MDDSVTGNFVPKLFSTQLVSPQPEVDNFPPSSPPPPPPLPPTPSHEVDSVFDWLETDWLLVEDLLARTAAANDQLPLTHWYIFFSLLALISHHISLMLSAYQVYVYSLPPGWKVGSQLFQQR